MRSSVEFWYKNRLNFLEQNHCCSLRPSRFPIAPISFVAGREAHELEEVGAGQSCDDVIGLSLQSLCDLKNQNFQVSMHPSAGSVLVVVVVVATFRSVVQCQRVELLVQLLQIFPREQVLIHGDVPVALVVFLSSGLSAYLGPRQPVDLRAAARSV